MLTFLGDLVLSCESLFREIYMAPLTELVVDDQSKLNAAIFVDWAAGGNYTKSG